MYTCCRIKRKCAVNEARMRKSYDDNARDLTHKMKWQICLTARVFRESMYVNVHIKLKFVMSREGSSYRLSH